MQGLEPGHTYEYAIGFYQDTNHDGTPDGGMELTVCSFRLSPSETGGGCRNHGRSPLASWFAPHLPDLVWAALYMIVPNTGNLVQYARFS